MGKSVNSKPFSLTASVQQMDPYDNTKSSNASFGKSGTGKINLNVLKQASKASNYDTKKAKSNVVFEQEKISSTNLKLKNHVPQAKPISKPYGINTISKAVALTNSSNLIKQASFSDEEYDAVAETLKELGLETDFGSMKLDKNKHTTFAKPRTNNQKIRTKEANRRAKEKKWEAEIEKYVRFKENIRIKNAKLNKDPPQCIDYLMSELMCGSIDPDCSYDPISVQPEFEEPACCGSWGKVCVSNRYSCEDNFCGCLNCVSCSVSTLGLNVLCAIPRTPMVYGLARECDCCPEAFQSCSVGTAKLGLSLSSCCCCVTGCCCCGGCCAAVAEDKI
ncbi:hypothetical protein [Candidatus Neptunochlamydia vexilliferae]|uniref:Uncharacterized protein n=1 Tax=Candidatus Neptunichlamydia vexilliferae TaxID=1651774 RepID=A0ABS0B0A3_9BACT|nr:hypothetical protein [Candidatus Neptunochlamydia vexilliferae]MBF5059005.1 hypothetical protein [Candidatus Neptunochlamydia vexilliferae]